MWFLECEKRKEEKENKKGKNGGHAALKNAKNLLPY